MADPNFILGDQLRDLPVTIHTDVYPGIDPEHHYKDKTYANKVVLITGASRGIGQEIARHYARSGATLSLIARQKKALNELAAELSKIPTSGPIATYAADVVDVQSVKEAVEGTVERFGKLDIVIANAGKGDVWTKPFTEGDPENWWRTMEVNVRGIYNFAHFTLPYLSKQKGYFVAVSSQGAYSSLPFASNYVMSKIAINRFVEYVVKEHPDVKSFAFHPGSVQTDLGALNDFIWEVLVDKIQLPACALLRLTSGQEDWLSGRYVSATWNLDEVEKLKEKILKEDALVSRLHLVS